MDHYAVDKVYGDLIRSGRKSFTWNPDGTLAQLQVSCPGSPGDLILTKVFTWNLDGTLQRWDLTVASTGDVIVREFTWDVATGQLQEVNT